MESQYADHGKASAPQPIRMRLPGWGGLPEKKMEDGSEPQPWHCRPFVDAATYGLELVYPYETECQVINEKGNVRFDWDYAREPGVQLDGLSFGVFDTTPARVLSVSGLGGYRSAAGLRFADAATSAVFYRSNGNGSGGD